MKIQFSSASLPKAGVLILLLPEGQALSGLAAEADRRTGGHIRRAMTAAGFTGRRDSTLDIVAPGGSFTRAVLFGLGNPAALRPLDLELLGGATAGISQGLKLEAVTIAASTRGTRIPAEIRR